jgi:hypothetical protein
MKWMIFGQSVDEKHETLIAKVGVVVSCSLLFMLFHFLASPLLSASTLARVRVRTFIALGRSSSSSGKHECVSQSFFPCSQALALFPSPSPYFSLFLVIFLFGVLRVLHMRRLASKHFLL